MTTLLTYILGIVAASCICSATVLGAAVYVYVRDLRDARRRMTAPKPMPRPTFESEDIWAELDRILDRARATA
jgi:hypothetical protein